jgi:hypothetical protein
MHLIVPTTGVEGFVTDNGRERRRLTVPVDVFVLSIFSMMVVGALVVLWIAMNSRRQVREMEHRERLAMIERGLVPPPEVDPAAFEQRLLARRAAFENPSSVRSRSAGVMMIALGIAFIFLVGFAGGEPDVGIGVGGAFAVLGAAFFLNALLLSRSRPEPRAPDPLPPLQPRQPSKEPEPPQSSIEP